MPYTNVEGEQIFYISGPRAGRELLLVIHGAGGDHQHWPDDLRTLASADCIMVDLPGHGKSGGSGRQSVDGYADFVESLIAALKLDALTLVGHSMGGAIVQTLALRQRSWLRRMILVGTGAKLRVAKDLLRLLDTDYPAAVDLICNRAFGASIPASLLERYRRNLLQTSPAVTRDDYLACDRFDVMEQIEAIGIPALILSGTADEFTPPKYGNYLQRGIRGATHTIIAEAGHMIALEKPVEFLEAVAAFVT